VSPDFLKKYEPEAVILMNPAYEAEVRKTLRAMKLNPKILPVNQLGDGKEDI
jgi:hypothetical protein